ncbi:MAG: hypothetical protein Kow0056_07970 [Coriobacteriia bacterium]
MRQTISLAVTRLLLAVLLVFTSVALTGCFDMTDADYLEAIQRWLDEHGEDISSDEDAAQEGDVELALTFPAGASPNVFTTGWVFGARCVAHTDDGDVDYSDQVKWSGTGSFSPDTGRTSRPAFSGPGTNEIVLTVEVGGKTIERTFSVQAVSPAGYAAVGDIARCPADAHGVPGDPVTVEGPITTGSPNVFVGGRPAARVGDVGVHAACSGSNTFEIIEGDSSVLINGRPAARIGSKTQHCGGVGEVISASGG